MSTLEERRVLGHEDGDESRRKLTINSIRWWGKSRGSVQFVFGQGTCRRSVRYSNVRSRWEKEEGTLSFTLTHHMARYNPSFHCFAGQQFCYPEFSNHKKTKKSMSEPTTSKNWPKISRMFRCNQGPKEKYITKISLYSRISKIRR